jgi:hypothetical protein
VRASGYGGRLYKRARAVREQMGPTLVCSHVLRYPDYPPSSY